MPRKQKQYHFIYKTTCILTNKFYIGMHSTDNLNDGYIGSGKILWYSIKKYGKDNHRCEIIEFSPDRQMLAIREEVTVNKEMINNPMCMNIVRGGDNALLDHPDATEWRRRGAIAANKINWANPEFRERKIKEISDRLKERHTKGLVRHRRDTFTGRYHTEESKQKTRDTFKRNGYQMGKNNSCYGTCWIYNSEERCNKKIKKEEIDAHLKIGWMKGRKMNYYKE
jgi:hypothetical protein